MRGLRRPSSLGTRPRKADIKNSSVLAKMKVSVLSKEKTHIKHRFEASIAAMLKGLLNSPIKEEREAGDEVDHPGEGDHLLKIL